ncbi:ABC transporter permease [Bacillus velezensis]|uniref:ABC transporter permease n=1 Tax=Bacillus velezensis TaxID=492670 RepID=UPI0039B0D692
MNNISFLKLTFKALFPYSNITSYIIFKIIYPFFHYSFYACLAYAVGGLNYINFVLVGNLFFLISHSMITNLISMFRFERVFKTTPYLIGCSYTLFSLLSKRVILSILDSTILFVISLITFNIFFDLHINFCYLPLIFLILICTLFSLTWISLLLGCLAIFFKNVNLYLNLVLSVFQILCGVNFPIQLLPIQIQNISKVIPLTNSLFAFRELLNNSPLNLVITYLAKEFMIGVAYLIFSILFIKLIELLIRKKGILL